MPTLVSEIHYSFDRRITAQQFAEICSSSGLRRPIEDLPRIQRMLDHANLIATAWDGEKLVGFARCLTDFSYCCYVSDLAVRLEYQKQSVGKTLLKLIEEQVGLQSNLILLAAPEAQDYYGKVGFEKAENAWIVKRKT